MAPPRAPWLVMVHGMSQDRRLFSAQVEEFKHDFRLLLIDLPGHGQAAHQPGPYGMAEFARYIEAALLQTTVEAVNFWGTHSGAGAGLLLAAKSPQRFRSLILESPVFPGRPLPAVVAVLERVRKVMKEEGIEQARKIWFDESEWFDVMRSHPDRCRARAHWEMVSRFAGQPWIDQGLAAPVAPVVNELAALRTPTLIVNGQHDLADFLEVARDLEALLANCRRVRIPDGGGFPLWEYPERTNLEVRRFLESVQVLSDR